MLVRRCFLICSLFLATGPAASTAVAFAPVDLSAEAGRPAAPLLSAESQALQAALSAASAPADAREQQLLESVREFYKARDFTPAWFTESGSSAQAAELRARMAGARADGLDPAPYDTARQTRFGTDLTRRTEADVEFSLAVARYVTHLSSGRLRPSDISRIITLEPEAPPAAEVLTRLSAQDDVSAALADYEPPHPQYRALKAKLAELYASNDKDDRILVPEGALLKPGEVDERVSVLRRRLEVVGTDEAANTYDEALVSAVKAFQEENGLTPDGILGPRTLIALNGRSPEEDIAAVIANMERWRWMPRDLGAFHVMVNVPEFMVRVVDGGAVVHQTRVVVGTPKNRTPTFSHVMDHLVVNPYWNVPTSIVAEEMLPAVRRNPGYFSRGGYEVFARIRGRFRQINPYWVDWHRVGARSIQVRQVPGDFNALGRIKFMFPNQHSVYLHDTPSKKLFQRDQRAFSHGCVRVENPLAFADAILPVAAPEWNSARLEKFFGGKERRINLDNPVPVHLAYFTATVDADGNLDHFEDIYGYDEETATRMQSQPEG